MKKEKRPIHVIIRECLRNEGPQFSEYLMETLEEEGWSAKSVYPVLQRMQRWDEVVKLDDDSYADYMYEEDEEAVTKTIENLRLFLCRDSTLDEIIEHLGWYKEDIENIKKIPKFGKKVKWKEPTERQKEESKIKRTVLMIAGSWLDFKEKEFNEKEVKLTLLPDNKEARSSVIKEIKSWVGESLKNLGKNTKLIEDAEKYKTDNPEFIPKLQLQYINHPLEQYPIDIYDWPEEVREIILEVDDYGRVKWNKKSRSFMLKNYPGVNPFMSQIVEN